MGLFSLKQRRLRHSTATQKEKGYVGMRSTLKGIKCVTSVVRAGVTCFELCIGQTLQ